MSQVPPAAKEWDSKQAPGTRHNALLNSNDPPQDSDIPGVLSAISETEAQLASVEDEIARVSEQLKKLRQMRSSLSSYRTRNRAILSPLRRMPPEILGEIFMCTLPSSNLRIARGKGIQITDSPWVLTHVCQDWKKISLSIPSLWSSVIVSYSPKIGPAAYPVAMVETQIARAQNSHLKIHFYGHEGAYPENSQKQIEMFKSLARHALRWGELNVQLTLALIPLLADLRGRLPSLRKLWIKWSRPNGLPVPAQSIDAFRDAPCLLDIGVDCYPRLLSVHFAAQHLTRYELEASWETHREILKLATNLVEACITNLYQSFMPESGEMIELACLRRLYVYDGRYDDGLNLGTLKFLYAPVLEELATGTFALDEYERKNGKTRILPHLDAFLTRSPSLRSLRLRLTACADIGVIIDILHRFPSIVELTSIIDGFDEDVGDDVLVRKLTVSGVTIVAPQLCSLCFGWESSLANIDYPALLRMVESRMMTVHCDLKKIALLTEGAFDSDPALTELKALREEGLDVLLLDGVDASEVMDDWVFHRRY
ncbi:hypothetical protein DFH06DRAFT_1167126 [Mycena polygramma]|nr:hypothetical protein DFH06DRAFT_1167126 [Mycena polygramma]